jgi:hypothetical protein
MIDDCRSANDEPTVEWLAGLQRRFEANTWEKSPTRAKSASNAAQGFAWVEDSTVQSRLGSWVRTASPRRAHGRTMCPAPVARGTCPRGVGCALTSMLIALVGRRVLETPGGSGRTVHAAGPMHRGGADLCN